MRHFGLVKCLDTEEPNSLIDFFRSEIERKMLNDLQLLQLEGGDLDFKSSVIAGATPLHIAAANGYLSVVEFLLEHHVSTDVEDDDLWQVRTTVLLRWLVVKKPKEFSSLSKFKT